MNRTRPFPSRLLLAACTLALSLAPFTPEPARADYRDTYLRGRDAAGAGDWSAVVRAMEEAIAEEPRESERIRFYGMRFDSYLPQYYLGLARSQLGDCKGALLAWEASTSQGVIQSLREYETLQELRGGCEERLAEITVEDVQVVEEEPESRRVPVPTKAVPSKADPVLVAPSEEALSRAVEEVKSAVGEAARQAERLGQLRADPELSGAWDRAPSLAAPAGNSAQLLERARARLAAGRKDQDPEALEEARQLAGQAQKAYAGVIRQAEARRREIREARADLARLEAEPESEEERRQGELRDQIAAAAGEVDRLLAGTRGQSGEIEEIGRTREALERLLKRSRDLRSLDSVADLEAFRDDLSRSSGRYQDALDEARRQADRAGQVAAGKAPAGPPEALRAAARAYFNGDYPAVLGALSGQELDDEAVAAQSLLFRAAARYALYLLGGEEEETLAEEAGEDVAFCRRLAPELTPDPRAFSPRFISFFEREE